MNLDRIECNIEMVRKSLSNFRDSVNNFHEMKIYAALGEALLWICVSDDWFQKNSKSYKARRKEHNMIQIISGVRRAFNAFKHNMELTSFHEAKGGFEFGQNDIVFPLEIPEITIHWSNIIDDNPCLAEKYKIQIQNYKDFLEGKEIYPTIKNVYDFLFSELQEMKRQ